MTQTYVGVSHRSAQDRTDQTPDTEKSSLIDYVSGKAPESEMRPSAVQDRFPRAEPG